MNRRMSEADASSSSSSSTTVVNTKSLIAEWRALGERVKEKNAKKYYLYVAREVANELQDGNKEGYLCLEKQPSGVSQSIYIYCLTHLTTSNN